MQDTWEIEQKYKVDQLDELERHILGIGFELRQVETHRDVYFRHPCRDFRQTDEAFRIRQLNDQTWVTYKGPRLNTQVKTRQEIELGLISHELPQWEQLIQLLGFEPLPPVCKTRKVFTSRVSSWQGCNVCLDRVDELGDFAEIELLVSSQETEQFSQIQNRILNLAQQLGLEQPVSQSYLSQLLAAKGIP